MKLLLTNDDGIDAPGLGVLEEVVRDFGTVAVVAPAEHQSGCSHRVNTARPVQTRQIEAGRHAVEGTPADCARLGLLHLAPETDLVVAGVNEGGNLGVDVLMSGTVAAVREAALLGKPGIAFSQFRRATDSLNWPATGEMTRRVLTWILARPHKPGTFWNVNFPDATDVDHEREPEIVICPLDPGHLPVEYHVEEGLFHYRGNYQDRPRRAGCDVDVCFNGHIALTRLTLHGSM